MNLVKVPICHPISLSTIIASKENLIIEGICVHVRKKYHNQHAFN